MTRPPAEESQALLDELDPILGYTGCIKSYKELPQFNHVMKMTNSMVSRCLLMNVVKVTKAQPTLKQFVDSEGWPTLNTWLAEYKKQNNTGMLLEMLELLQKLPVTITALKKGTMGKLIKQLSKHESPEVKASATSLLTKWMSLFGRAAGKADGDPAGEGTAGGQVSSQKASKLDSAPKPKKRKESRKDDVPPIEATPPPGPLVALGQPRPKLQKRPLDVVLGNAGSASLAKKPLPSPTTADDRNASGSPVTSPAPKTKGPAESLGFMNALSSQAHQKMKKAKKIVPRQQPNNVKHGSVPPGRQEMEEQGRSVPAAAEGRVTGAEEGESLSHQNSTENADEEGPPKSKKKRVSWAPEDSLLEVQYFEVDESERVHHGSGNFLDAAQREKYLERQAMHAARMMASDRMEEAVPWKRPAPLQNVSTLVEPSSQSEERVKQAEREQRVLAQLFFNRESLPPSAAEPDPQPKSEETETAVIPLYEPGVEPAPMMDTAPGPMGAGPGGMPNYHPPNIHPGPGMGMPPQGGIVPPPDGMHHPPRPFGPPMGGPMHRPPPMGPHFGPPPHGNRPLLPPPRMPPGEGGPFHGQDMPFPGQDMPYPGQDMPFPDQDMPYPGQDMPYPGQGRGRGRISRGHPNPKVCWHYITHGCLRGDSCKFLHPTDVPSNA